MKRIPIVILAGPTASGKSSLAVRLAKHFSTDVIHADSRQIFQDMDIGTAKPCATELSSVKHHLLSFLPPDSSFTAEDFVNHAVRVIKNITEQGKLPLLEGGTGLYIRSLVDGIFSSPPADEEYRRKLRNIESKEKGKLFSVLSKVDPGSAERIHPNDIVRIVRALEVHHTTGGLISEMQKNTRPLLELKPFYFGFNWPRNILYKRIDTRVDDMIKSGLVDEVKALLDRGYTRELQSMQGIGYRQICDYIDGSSTLLEAVEDIKRESRRYAKRQITWFSRVKGFIWLEPLDNYFDKLVDFVNLNCFYSMDV